METQQNKHQFFLRRSLKRIIVIKWHDNNQLCQDFIHLGFFSCSAVCQVYLRCKVKYDCCVHSSIQQILFRNFRLTSNELRSHVSKNDFHWNSLDFDLDLYFLTWTIAQCNRSTSQIMCCDLQWYAVHTILHRNLVFKLSNLHFDDAIKGNNNADYYQRLRLLLLFWMDVFARAFIKFIEIFDNNTIITVNTTRCVKINGAHNSFYHWHWIYSIHIGVATARTVYMCKSQRVSKFTENSSNFTKQNCEQENKRTEGGVPFAICDVSNLLSM